MSVLTSKRDDMCYCPGCSHGLLLEHLGAAIDRLQLSPENVCLVSDIGCIGTADRYYTCHTFHGLHGRSVTYAEGIKRVRPECLVVVLIGDGGCGIGTGHLVHAARRGVGIKIMVCNNFNFGMTGGQHSPTTPLSAHTPTTPQGATEHPFDICQTVVANGASHVGRFSAFDPNCVDHIEAALRCPGFALLDLWELCVAYFVSANKLTRPGLNEMSERLQLPFGLLYDTPAPAPTAAAQPARPPKARTAPAAPVAIPWDRRTEICVAGSAGQRVRSAAGVIGEIALAGGLFVAQQDDFPITVRKGHSISNLIIAPEPIHYDGVDDPDLVLLLSRDGMDRMGGLEQLRPGALVIADEELPDPKTPARVRRVSVRATEKEAGKTSAALANLVYGLVEGGWLDAQTLRAAADAGVAGSYRDENLRANQVGLGLRPTEARASGCDPLRVVRG